MFSPEGGREGGDRLNSTLNANRVSRGFSRELTTTRPRRGNRRELQTFFLSFSFFLVSPRICQCEVVEIRPTVRYPVARRSAVSPNRNCVGARGKNRSPSVKLPVKQLISSRSVEIREECNQRSRRGRGERSKFPKSYLSRSGRVKKALTRYGMSRDKVYEAFLRATIRTRFRALHNFPRSYELSAMLRYATLRCSTLRRADEREG